MTAQDDLAPLLMARPQQALRFGQGELVHWDADAFTNRVRFRGVELTNLPVLSGAEALTFRSGDVVSLVGWGASWAILGRLVTPGSGTADRAISFLQTTLATAIVDDLVEALLTSPAGIELAAFVIGNRVHAASVATLQGTTSSTPTNLTTTGPSVTVDVSDSGKMIVMVSADIRAPAGTTVVTGSAMGYDISGPTNRTATFARAAAIIAYDNVSGNEAASGTRVIGEVALSPGTYTVTAKYWRVFGSDPNTADFADRHIVAIGF